MSEYGLPVIEQLDPVLAVNEPRAFSAKNGGEVVTIQTFRANNPGNSNIVVSCTPPSGDTLISPAIVAYITYRIVFTGDNAIPLVPILNLGATDAPRQWPFHQTCTAMDMRLNGTSFNTQMQQWFPIVSRVGTYTKEINTWSTTTPSKQDTFQEYYDASNPNQPLSPLNPLLDYNGSDTTSIGRGAHPVEIVSNTGAGAEVVFTSAERLLCSPLFPNTGGITGIQDMQFNCTFSNLNRVWCHGADPARSQVTGMTVTVEAFELHCRFITAKPNFPIPRSLIMPYFQYNTFNTSATALASGASTTLINPNTQLGAVPESIYIMIKRDDAEQYQSNNSYLYTDTCMRITNLNILFNNRDNILANYSPADLFRMSSRNGLNMTYPDWFGSTNSAGDTFGSGSFICIDVANDLGLREGESPGTPGQYNLTVRATTTNFGAQARNVQMTVIVKYVGTTVVPGNGAGLVTSINPITSQEVMRAALSNDKEIGDINDELMGGRFSLIKSIKKAIPKIHKAIRKHHLLSRGLAVAGAPGWATEGARLVGYGVQDAKTRRPFTENYMGGARLY